MFGNSAAEEALATSSATYNCVLHIEVTYFRSHKNMNMLFNNKEKTHLSCVTPGFELKFL